MKARGGIDSRRCLARVRALRYAQANEQQEARMPGKTIKIRSTEGGEFDCYLAHARRPTTRCRPWCWPAPCTASTRTSASSPTNSPATASSRRRPTCSGARCRGRSATTTSAPQERSQPRLEKIKTGERDMADTLAHLRTLPQFNGRAATMGFCYGGPYAILGPKRLGYAAGISCHGIADAGLHQGARRRHASRSASSGATRITARRRRCSTPTARCRRA